MVVMEARGETGMRSVGRCRGAGLRMGVGRGRVRSAWGRPAWPLLHPSVATRALCGALGLESLLPEVVPVSGCHALRGQGRLVRSADGESRSESSQRGRVGSPS